MAWLRRVGLLMVLLAPCAQQAGAQSYPARPVSIAVPYAPGGGVDVVTRLVAQKLTERLGQAFLIDNRTGAGGLLATLHVAKAAPDGHTLLLATDAQLAAQVTLRKSLPYDPTKDFVPVALVGNTPFGLIVNASLPAQSVADLVGLAKQHPGKISYGSSGAGGIPHLLAELFMSMTGTQMTHVPYKGTAEALRDVVAGHVPVTFSGLVPVVGLLKEGKIRVLGVTSTKRVRGGAGCAADRGGRRARLRGGGLADDRRAGRNAAADRRPPAPGDRRDHPVAGASGAVRQGRLLRARPDAAGAADRADQVGDRSLGQGDRGRRVCPHAISATSKASAIPARSMNPPASAAD